MKIYLTATEVGTEPLVHCSRMEVAVAHKKGDIIKLPKSYEHKGGGHVMLDTVVYDYDDNGNNALDEDTALHIRAIVVPTALFVTGHPNGLEPGYVEKKTPTS